MAMFRLRGALVAAVLAAAALSINLGVLVPALATGPEGVSTFSGSTSVGTVYATNSGAGPALEGVKTVTGAYGAIYGAGISATGASVGVRGHSAGPSSRGVWGDATLTRLTRAPESTAHRKTSPACDAVTCGSIRPSPLRSIPEQTISSI